MAHRLAAVKDRSTVMRSTRPTPGFDSHRSISYTPAVTRVGLAVVVVLLLAAGRANATNGCGLLGEPCCPPNGVLPCNSPFVCDPNNVTGCTGLVAPGGSGGAAAIFCPGTCVEASPTPTPTATSTPTPTDTATATPTATPTFIGLGQSCSAPTECASGFCAQGVCCNEKCDGPLEACDRPGRVGTCSKAAPAPAVSTNGLVIVAVLLAGVGIFQLVQRRRLTH